MLNALRHQRNWNYLYDEQINPLQEVLNALRHQRNWNSDSGKPRRTIESVLNALRHQRNWNWLVAAHNRRLQEGAQRLTASKELEPIISRAVRYDEDQCAQRLTASKELEPVCTGDTKPVHTAVLNALRHQRNWNRARKKLKTQTQSCAQRLTASKELEPRTPPLPDKCNTLLYQGAQRLTASKELEQYLAES